MFWHEYAKSPRVACKNPITEGDFYWIFARNYEGTEQLRIAIERARKMKGTLTANPKTSN